MQGVDDPRSNAKGRAGAQERKQVLFVRFAHLFVLLRVPSRINKRYESSMKPSLPNILLATHEQLFRLALLTTGSQRTATRLLTQAAALARTQDEAETALLRNLHPKRRGYGRWQPTANAQNRAGLDTRQAQALMRLIAHYAPAERLAVGLSYLRGLTSEEISLITGQAVEGLNGVFARFRVDAALALGQVPADAERTTLVGLDMWLDGRLSEEEATMWRSLVFADAEMRALRDGLLATRNLLPQAINGLFAVAAPATLLPSLQRSITAAPRRSHRPWLQQRTALATLVSGVLAVAAVIAFAPALIPRTASRSAAPTAATLISGAIRRFEQPPRTSGVLHERYRVEITGQTPATLERWYSYAAPNALAVEVRGASDQAVRFAMRSDGTGKIGYQVAQRYSSESPNASRRIDYQLSPDAAQAALPVLRSVLMPISLYGNQRAQPEISSLYLAQASASQPVVLGRSSVAGREATLLRYSTNQLPTEDQPGRAREVLLSFDNQLHALLDVTVVESGSSESVAYRPWRAEQIEVLDNVPDSQFSFDSVAAQQVNGPRSITMPTIPDRFFTTLDTARRESSQPLLLPTTLPDAMRGLVINRRASSAPNQFTAFYEGEFRSLLLSQDSLFSANNITWRGGEETIGNYRYRIADAFGAFRNSAAAEVYPLDKPNERTNIVLIDAYSTPAAREQQLRRIVASLAPVTDANVASFQRSMVPMANGG